MYILLSKNKIFYTQCKHPSRIRLINELQQVSPPNQTGKNKFEKNDPGIVRAKHKSQPEQLLDMIVNFIMKDSCKLYHEIYNTELY